LSACAGGQWFGVGAGNGGGVAYNLNFQIPFQRSVRVTVQHQSSDFGGFYMIVRGTANKSISIGDIAIPRTARLVLQKVGLAVCDGIGWLCVCV
jgi:hypothetical protein